MMTEPFAFLDPAMRADPYPAYAALRAMTPFAVPDAGLVLLGRHADCEEMLGSPTAGADRRRSKFFEQRIAQVPPETRALFERSRPFLFMDPPDHTRLRGLVAKAFTRRRVENLRPRVQQLVDDALDRAGEAGEMELVDTLAYPLPVTIISDLLGVPEEDRKTFEGWSHALAASLDAPLMPPPLEEAARQFQAMQEFRAYFRELANERRRAPQDDLLSALVEIEEAGDRLTEDELLSTCVLLLIAGHETTVSLISNGVLALLRNPSEWQLLVDDPSLAEGAVEETLRYDAPVQFTGRVGLDDITISGTTVRRGEVAILMLAAANRDEQRYDEPDRFDIRRSDSSHLAFSKGAHFCLGAPLARLEAQVTFATVAQRLEAPALLSEPAYKPNAVLRGPAELRLSFDSVRPRVPA